MCDRNLISITNQDVYPLLLVVTSEDDAKEQAIFEVPGARLDDETGVYVPMTSKVCMKDAPAGPLVIKYSHGNKCVHRVFDADQWMTGSFAYVVPAWNAGDPGEVCKVSSNSNTNKNARSNDSPVDEDDDDDSAPGNSNGHWWSWFWRRQGKRRVNTTHMATMTTVSLIVLVALVWYILSRRRR